MFFNSKNRVSGFVSIILALAGVLVVIGMLGYYINRYQSKNKQQPQVTKVEEVKPNDEMQSQTPITTTNPTATQIPVPSATPTQIPTDTTCPYNLIKTPGSVKVNTNSQSGEAVGDQSIELSAKTGCKVLLDKSSDRETKNTSGGKSVDFTNVPPGSYTVRSYHKGQWSDHHAITVNSAQQTTVTVTVNVPSTPTPTP